MFTISLKGGKERRLLAVWFWLSTQGPYNNELGLFLLFLLKIKFESWLKELRHDILSHFFVGLNYG